MILPMNKTWLTVLLWLIVPTTWAFIILKCRANTRRIFSCCHAETRVDDNGDDSLSRALQQAKNNRESLQSPGAGVQDAFLAAEAAYADLILTSIDQRELQEELCEEDLADLSRGGTMWEDGAKDRQNSKKGGFVGDLFNALSALTGGAHIVKDKNGET